MVIKRADPNPYRWRVEEFPERLFDSDALGESLQHRASVRERLASINTPVILEFGSGSGGHILDRAERSPEITFIGFELRYKRAVRTLEKAQFRGIENVFIFRADIRSFEEHFADASLEGIYMNFPDPWAKERWKKHRMFNIAAFSAMKKKIKPRGFFSFKSDHQEYFQTVAESLRNDPEVVFEAYTEDFYKSDYLDGNVASEFEKLFRAKALPVYYLRVKFEKQISIETGDSKES